MKKIILLVLVLIVVVVGIVGFFAYQQVSTIVNFIKTGDQYYTSGEFQKAVTNYEKALRIYPVAQAQERLKNAKAKLVEQQVDLTGLIAYFPFNERNIKDLSGKNEKASAQGADWISSGKVGGCYEFSEELDCINISSPELETYSITGWLKPKGIQGENARFFDSDNVLDVAVGGENRNLKFNLSGEANTWIATTTQLLDDQWTMVTITGDNQGIYFYVNGELVYQHVQPARLKVRKFGANLANPKEDSYLGLMDEIMIFNRPLSAENVKKIYQNSDKLVKFIPRA